MAVGFLAPTHVPIRVHLSDYRASLASVCMVSVHSVRMHRPGQHRRVGRQRDPSEPAVIAHWVADPNRLSGKRRSTLFGYVLPGSPRRATRAGKGALRGKKSPSGRPDRPKGLRQGRIAALLPPTLAPGVNGAALAA
jgi:hypothetical protein